jgi:hypothetical protein
MKETAARFKRAQAEAKKKALDTAAIFDKYEQKSTEKQAHADQHKAGIAGSKEEANAAGAQAQHGTNSAQEGEGKQNESKSNSSAEAHTPDPGEKPGWTHPFKRIIWKIKKWACEKAAKVFGWIQEKIASLILEGLCGVSMGDLKEYTTALHHRMDFSKGVAVTAEGATDGAKGKEGETKGKAKDYGEEALNDAKDCDQNMADADKFLADVSITEQELAQEQEKAASFIAGLKKEAQAEKDRKTAAAKKKEEEQQKQAGAPHEGDQGHAASHAQAAAPDHKEQHQAKAENSKKAQKPDVPAADKGKVKSAAGYVASRIPQYRQQLVASRDNQQVKLDTARAKAKSSNHLRIGDSVINAFDTATGDVRAQMERVAGGDFNTADAIHGAAEQIKQAAKGVDGAIDSANQGLNGAFRLAYQAMKEAKHKGKAAGHGPAPVASASA